MFKITIDNLSSTRCPSLAFFGSCCIPYCPYSHSEQSNQIWSFTPLKQTQFDSLTAGGDDSAVNDSTAADIKTDDKVPETNKRNLDKLLDQEPEQVSSKKFKDESVNSNAGAGLSSKIKTESSEQNSTKERKKARISSCSSLEENSNKKSSRSESSKHSSTLTKDNVSAKRSSSIDSKSLKKSEHSAAAIEKKKTRISIGSSLDEKKKSPLSETSKNVSISNKSVPTPSTEPETSGYFTKKVRIAHCPSYEVETKKPVRKKCTKSPRQIMEERLAKYKASQPSTSTKPPPLTLNSSQSLNNNNNNKMAILPKIVLSEKKTDLKPTATSPYQVSTANKKAGRVAHVPKTPTTFSSAAANGKTVSTVILQPIEVASIKLPKNTRTNCLKKLFAELKGLGTSAKVDEAQIAQEAKEMEKDVAIRSRNLINIYSSVFTSKIFAIRTKSTGNSSPSVPNQYSTQVSHQAILDSKAVNCSVLKREKVTFETLSDTQKESVLISLSIPLDQLASYGFPIPDPESGLANFPLSGAATSYFDTHHIPCRRCGKLYSNPQPEDTQCIYHWGHIYKFKVGRAMESQYSCCRLEPNSGGCNISSCHVNDGFLFTENRTGFAETVPNSDPIDVFALDCEMCYTETGLELSRLTILNCNAKVIFETLVKPKSKILDYNTRFSGINKELLDPVKTTLEEARAKLIELIPAQSFICGHGLDSDFKALKLYHKRVIDTTHLFPHKRGLPFKRSLKNLSSDYLKRIIQDDSAGHDSNEDALAALDLFKSRLNDEMNKFRLGNARSK